MLMYSWLSEHRIEVQGNWRVSNHTANAEMFQCKQETSLGGHLESEMGELVSFLVIQYSWIYDLLSVKVELHIFLIHSMLE